MTIKTYCEENIKINVSIKSIINEVEKAYIALRDGKVKMPRRLFMDLNPKDFLLMGPAYIKDSGYFGAKTLSLNATKIAGNPKISELYTLFNEADGTVAGIYDSAFITQQRTGAKSAVAAKYLARKDSHVLGLLGMGKQAFSHLEAMKEILPIKKVLCWTYSSAEKHEDFIDFAREEMGVEIEITSPEAIAKNSDILIDVSYSMQPLAKDAWIPNGTLVIGTYHRSEFVQFEAATVNRSTAYVDFDQNTDCGTIANAKTKEELEQIIELKDIIGRDDLRVTKNSLVYFQSGGTSIEDLAGAIAIKKVLGKN